MRTLHIGLRVSDLERSLAFYTGLGYQKLGEVPETAFGSLTMLKLFGPLTHVAPFIPRIGTCHAGSWQDVLAAVFPTP